MDPVFSPDDLARPPDLHRTQTEMHRLQSEHDLQFERKDHLIRGRAPRAPVIRERDQSRRTRAGSVRTARQAGIKHAASEARIITAKAVAKTNGSRGLTLYRRFPSNRVNPMATTVPRSAPPAINTKPRDIPSRNRLDALAPSAIRIPNSRVLCEPAYATTPNNPMAASSTKPRDIPSRNRLDALAP